MKTIEQRFAESRTVLATLRLKTGLTQRALGSHIGRSSSYVHGIESSSYWTRPAVGSVHKIPWEEANKIVEVLGVSLKTLFPDEDGRPHFRLDMSRQTDSETHAALQRLFEIARGCFDQSRHIENFLLDWRRSAYAPTFNVTQLWGFDPVVQDDVMTVFLFIVRNNGRADGLGFDDEFKALESPLRRNYERELELGSDYFSEHPF